MAMFGRLAGDELALLVSAERLGACETVKPELHRSVGVLSPLHPTEQRPDVVAPNVCEAGPRDDHRSRSGGFERRRSEHVSLKDEQRVGVIVEGGRPENLAERSHVVRRTHDVPGVVESIRADPKAVLGSRRDQSEDARSQRLFEEMEAKRTFHGGRWTRAARWS
jgi:hypothetical protein